MARRISRKSRDKFPEKIPESMKLTFSRGTRRGDGDELNHPFAILLDDVDVLFTTLGEKKAAWDHYKEQFMSEWIADHPGTRPAAWWEFDSPEPRNKKLSEFDQLRQMGELSPGEIRNYYKVSRD